MAAKFINTAIGLAVTAVCLWLAFRGIDPSAVAERLRHVDWRYAVPMLGVLVLFFVMKSYRWALLLRPAGRLSTGAVARALLIGFMGNNVLPLRLGEGMRAFVVSRKHGIPVATVLSSIVLERLLDAACAVTLLVGAVACLPELADAIPALFAWMPVAAVGVLVLFAGLTLYVWRTAWFIAVVGWWLRLPRIFPEHAIGGIEGVFRAGAVGLEALRRPSLGWKIVALSLGHWLVLAAMPALALAALDVEIGVAASTMTNSVIALGVAAPSAPGFFGVVQYCFRISVVPLGVPPATAVAASWLFHLIQFVPVTVVGLICLSTTGLGWRGVDRAEVATPGAAPDAEPERPTPEAIPV